MLYQQIIKDPIQAPLFMKQAIYQAIILTLMSSGSVYAGNPMQTTTECSFANKLPGDFAVFAAGDYAGRKLDLQIDGSGHYATQMDVEIRYTEKPVVLMLGAYEPTIWNISWAPGTKIAAVLLSGFHKQALSGLPDNVSRIISTAENKGKCGSFYIDQQNLGSLNAIARRTFNQKVDLVYFAKNGSILIGDEPPTNEKLLQSGSIQYELLRRTDLSGVPGLKQAVERGLLRAATLADAEEWQNRESKIDQKRDIPSVADQRPIKPKRPALLNAYVVLRAFSYPGGLYGGNSAVFFIPNGVPKPKGNPGPSTVYDFNTLTCEGGLCK